jgi:hypothetical protein
MSEKVVNSIFIFVLQFVVFLHGFGVQAQVNQMLNFETPGFYLLPSETGTHANKWVASAYINSKVILKDMPLRSYAFSGDYQIKRGLQSIYVGGGLGTMKILGSPYQENEFYVTGAYHKIIRNHTLHIGFQPGLLTRNLDTGSLQFPDQYDRETGNYNPDVPTNETVALADNAVGLNLNVGLAYGYRMNQAYSKIVLAARNLTKPNLSFSNNSVTQARQWIAQVKTDYYLTNVDIVKAFLMLRNTSMQTETFLGGQLMNKLVRKNLFMNEISGGTFVALRNNKHPNNIVFQMGFGMQNLKVGLAYSYNFVGNQASVNSFNTYEVVLSLVGLNTNLEHFRVPCEIY